MAIVKLKTLNRKLNVLRSTNDFSTGEKCFAIGNLQNYGVSVTEGIISKKAVNIENNGKVINAIQCDIIITEGDSGGALLNKKGELIGITTFRTKDIIGKVVYGIGFAIRYETIMQFLNN